MVSSDDDDFDGIPDGELICETPEPRSCNQTQSSLIKLPNKKFAIYLFTYSTCCGDSDETIELTGQEVWFCIVNNREPRIPDVVSSDKDILKLYNIILNTHNIKTILGVD